MQAIPRPASAAGEVQGAAGGWGVPGGLCSEGGVRSGREAAASQPRDGDGSPLQAAGYPAPGAAAVSCLRDSGGAVPGPREAGRMAEAPGSKGCRSPAAGRGRR